MTQPDNQLNMLPIPVFYILFKNDIFFHQHMVVFGTIVGMYIMEFLSLFTSAGPQVSNLWYYPVMNNDLTVLTLLVR